jgi:hypothetical protein
MSKSLATFWTAFALCMGYLGRDGVRQPSEALVKMPIPASVAAITTKTFRTPKDGTRQVLLTLPGCMPANVSATWRVIDSTQSAISGGTVDLGKGPCALSAPQATLGSFVSAMNASYGVRVIFHGSLASLGAGDPMLIVR